MKKTERNVFKKKRSGSCHNSGQVYETLHNKHLKQLVALLEL